MSETAKPRDLTRWNRAGLSRFDYVDGNAAVWLEELRLAMLARFVRGETGEARTEKFWRELLIRELTPQDLDDVKRYSEKLAWKTLLGPLPAKPETVRERNERLLSSYGSHTGDQASEIMRAFSRAAHVLLGHVNAYANEGYLRTATQWDSMRKLAAMIGYQPAPAAAASTVVALVVDSGPDTVEIERGVAMSFTPPGGGKPVIFETVETIGAHRELNAARAEGHDRNLLPLSPNSPTPFSIPDRKPPKPGDSVVLMSEGGSPTPWATYIAGCRPSDDMAFADIELEGSPTAGQWVTHATVLMTNPEKVLRGRPRSSNGNVVIQIASTGQFQQGAVVFYVDSFGHEQLATIASVEGGRVELSGAANVPDTTQLFLATQYAVTNGYVATNTNINQVWFTKGDEIIAVGVDEDSFIPANGNGKSGYRTKNNLEGGTHLDHRFERPAGASAVAYARNGATPVTASMVGASPPISATFSDSARIVEFQGKPSASLVAGAWFAARKGTDTPKALRVEGVGISPESYFVSFDAELDGPISDYEFHGPMTVALRPVDYDRGQNAVFAGGIMLAGLSTATQKLVKTGRKLIVEDERPGIKEPLLLTIASALDGAALTASGAGGAGNVLLTIAESPSSLDGFISGWTAFRLNTLRATHGESRGAKVLGSGNAELLRQSFHFAVKDVTFVPSSAAESGVAPDIDVTVQDVIWAYRDLSDPTAEDTDSWSALVREDDTLDIVFRRRLPTGSNSVAVRRHRVGTGPMGNAVPPLGFKKPSKKHRYVTAIVQPFAASGGAEREPVASMRDAAPARLAANGRAVSLKDFEKLAGRHAGVWQARATQLPEVGAAIRLVVVAAYGAPVYQAFADTLSNYIRQRCIPGARIAITDFVRVPVRIRATIRVDVSRFDKNDVADASLAALADAFGLRRRGLGQQLLVGEVLAALEKVEGLETAVAVLTLDPAAPPQSRSALEFPQEGLSAIFPDANQVAFVPDTGSLTVIVEAI